MPEKVIQKFNQFIEEVDKKIMEFIGLNNKRLTQNISRIQGNLWRNYKEINGTSAGFYGIDEYIVFSTFKNFIEGLNSPQKFEPKEINKDLRFFELKKNNKVLIISRASSLKHININSERKADISIVRREGNSLTPVAVIEIKNHLDKESAISAINILSQVQNDLKDDHTKYALFSFGRISVHDRGIRENLKSFANGNNNFIITNEQGNTRNNEGIKVVDLSCFLNIIKNEVKL